MANNHPFRGHKHDPWEGGTRVAAFLSGGFLPQNLRGKVTGDKVVHIADWCVRPSRRMISQLHLVFVAELSGVGCRYPTFCRLAGIDPRDDVDFGDGVLHPIDGVVNANQTTHACLPEPS